MEALAMIGGAEITALVGSILQASDNNIPVLIVTLSHRDGRRHTFAVHQVCLSKVMRSS